MAKKLVTICREGSRYDIYKALQITMAKKLDDCESGRELKSQAPLNEPERHTSKRSRDATA